MGQHHQGYEGRGVLFSERKRYVTLEWPLRISCGCMWSAMMLLCNRDHLKRSNTFCCLWLVITWLKWHVPVRCDAHYYTSIAHQWMRPVNAHFKLTLPSAVPRWLVIWLPHFCLFEPCTSVLISLHAHLISSPFTDQLWLCNLGTINEHVTSWGNDKSRVTKVKRSHLTTVMQTWEGSFKATKTGHAYVRDSSGARLCVNAAPTCQKAHHFLPRVP